MKKVLALLSLVLVSASAFALNVEAPADEKCPGKAYFEQNVATLDNVSFIAQNILINLADPMAKMTDEQALPLAQCYATYQVKGQGHVEFVRANADIFPGDVSKKEATNLRTFAGRVEALSQKASFDEMATQDNNYFIAQNILINLADPFAKLSDSEAAPVAKVYAGFKVKGEAMPKFAAKMARQYPELEELGDFAGRVEFLAK